MRRQLSQQRELEVRDDPEAFGAHEQLWRDDYPGIMLEPGKDGCGRCRRASG